MMKIHSKHYALRKVTAFVITTALVIPLFASAEVAAPERPGTIKVNFCARIDAITTKVSTGIAEREAKYLAKRGEGRGKLAERFENRDMKRTENRSEWDTRRDEWRTKFGEKATTTAQKAAVEKFITDMDTSIAARRSIVDGAVKSFRSGLEVAVVARQSSVDTALLTFKQETDAAVTKAKSDCTSGVAPQVARDTYVSAMKAAREKMRATVKAIDAKKETLKPLAETRRITIEKAVADFKVLAEKAREELKKSLSAQ